jgi:Flp pilus assembly protein TadG
MKSTVKTIRRPGERGNALVEMGVAAPMLMLLLSAVIDFGRVFYYTDAAVSAARAGAQYGIQSAANFGNYAGMQLAAQTDAQGIQNFSATATSYCQSSSGTSVACTASGAEGYVKVTTAITYNLLVSWPWIPNPLPVGGVAIMRCQ